MVERFYKYLFDMAIFRYQSKPIRHMDEAEGRLQTRIQLLQSINMIVFVRVSWPANISTDPGAAQPHPSSDKKKITRIMLIIRCCGSWRWWPCQGAGGPSVAVQEYPECLKDIATEEDIDIIQVYPGGSDEEKLHNTDI